MRYTRAIVTMPLFAAILLAGSWLTAGATAQGSDQRRAFYLTTTKHTGGEAPNACAVGFRMASLWEIADPSNFRYETLLGVTVDDAGSGPPAATPGWIRTGTAASGFGPAVRANCHAWQSSSARDYGTRARLSPGWYLAAGRASPWFPDDEPCSVPQLVWCVQE